MDVVGVNHGPPQWSPSSYSSSTATLQWSRKAWRHVEHWVFLTGNEIEKSTPWKKYDHLGLSENSVPLHLMVNDHYPVFKWLFHWEYTPFSDKPTSWEATHPKASKRGKKQVARQTCPNKKAAKWVYNSNNSNNYSIVVDIFLSMDSTNNDIELGLLLAPSQHTALLLGMSQLYCFCGYVPLSHPCGDMIPGIPKLAQSNQHGSLVMSPCFTSPNH